MYDVANFLFVMQGRDMIGRERTGTWRKSWNLMRHMEPGWDDQVRKALWILQVNWRVFWTNSQGESVWIIVERKHIQCHPLLPYSGWIICVVNRKSKRRKISSTQFMRFNLNLSQVQFGLFNLFYDAFVILFNLSSCSDLVLYMKSLKRNVHYFENFTMGLSK